MQHNFSFIFIIHTSNNILEANLKEIAENRHFPLDPLIRPNLEQRSKEHATNFSFIFVIYTSGNLLEANLGELAENRHFPSNPSIRPNSGQRSEDDAAQFQLHIHYPHFK